MIDPESLKDPAQENTAPKAEDKPVVAGQANTGGDPNAGQGGGATQTGSTTVPTAAPTGAPITETASQATTPPANPQQPTDGTPAVAQTAVSKEGQEQKGTTQKMEEGLAKINRQAKEKATQEKAASIGMNYIDIATSPINPDLLKLITPEQAKANLIMPFYRLGKKLRITVAHPTSPDIREIVNSLKKQGYMININLSSEEGILESLQLYDSDQFVVKKEIDTKLDEAKIQTYEKELKDIEHLGDKIKTVTSEEAVYLVQVAALRAGSSDIHMEAEEKYVRVRFRIDGHLHEVFRIDKSVWENISNQIKYQANLRVNVNNIPQDGRFNFQVNDRKIDIRVSVLPTEYGESFVLRLLDSGKHLVSFEELGFSGQYLQKIENLTKITHGMILVTGPTGSGKTTSLYTMLSKFNKPNSKIITLEDPIEYHLEGVSQSQIQEKEGYTFASGLRSILRQDPEVIMIGEIRDKETAETAAQAALTGHVLLSTLHTNSAIETIPRLINIGVPPFMIAPSLSTILAQRLARSMCPECSEQKPIPKSELEEIQRVVATIQKVRPAEKIVIPETLPEAKGCDVCSHTGYKGRVTLVEMLDVDNEMKDLILNKASTTKMIEAARRKGMITLREDGMLKVLQGITTLEEVHRVTSIGQ